MATLGVDEHAWVHASANRCTGYTTGIVDITPHRPARLTVVPGRTGKVYADREAAWRQQIRVAALDPFRGYATALPDATRRLDAFHLVALANKMVDEVRQRIQQKTLGHRSRNGDPLYEIRRLWRPSIKTLPNRTRRNIDSALQVGDRHRRLSRHLAAALHLPHPTPEVDGSRRSPR